LSAWPPRNLKSCLRFNWTGAPSDAIASLIMDGSFASFQYAVWTNAVASSSMTAETSGQSWPRPHSFFRHPQPQDYRMLQSHQSACIAHAEARPIGRGDFPNRIFSHTCGTSWLNVFESASRYSRCSRICSGSASGTTKLKNQSYPAEVPAVGTPHQQLLRYSTSWRVFNTGYASFAS